MMVFNGEFKSPLPITGSHEPTGTVVKLGPEAKGFSKGDRVGALTFTKTCTKCPDCKAGRPLFCDNASMGGITQDGALAEYMVVDSKTAVHLPDNLSFEQAAPLTCAGATVFNALKACNLKAGQSVGIIGLGSLGHIAIQLAKCMVRASLPFYRDTFRLLPQDLKVAGVDARKEPIDLAKSLQFAPDLCINVKDGDEAARKQVDEMTKDAAYPGLDAYARSVYVSEYKLTVI